MAELASKVISLTNKKTSIRLAVAEWEAIDIICQRENIKRNNLIELINDKKDENLGLTCSVRLFSIIYFYRLLTNQQQNYASSHNQTSPIFDAIYSIL